MGYGTDGLTFNTLRGGNTARLPQFKNNLGEPAHSEPDGSDWSDSQWFQAAVGELGEYANLRKKLDRGDLGVTADEMRSAYDTEVNLNSSGEASEVKRVLADELADTVIYLDLLCFRLGIDLGAAVMAKFNRTSHKVGSTIRLSADDWHHVQPEELDAGT